MELFNTIMEVINNNAFPIIMCVLLFMDNREMRKEHKNEVDTLSKAVENNTVVMSEVKEVLTDFRK